MLLLYNDFILCIFGINIMPVNEDFSLLQQEQDTNPPAFWQYLVSAIAAIIIGINCALISYYYLSTTSLFASCLPVLAGVMPILIPLCVFAAFILNFTLYFADGPKEIQNFVQFLYDLIAMKLRASDIIPEVIAISAGILMALFTYHALVSTTVPLLPILANPLCIAFFCCCYFIGTYILYRSCLSIFGGSINEFIHKIVTTFIPSDGNHIILQTIEIIAKIAFVTLMLCGWYYTNSTIISAAILAVNSLFPVAAMLIPIVQFFGCIYILAELTFTLNVAHYIFQNLDFSNINKPTLIALFICLILLIPLNAIPNGVIAAGSSLIMSNLDIFKAVCGIILSSAAMLKGGYEVLTSLIAKGILSSASSINEITENHNILNTFWTCTHLIVFTSACIILPSFGMNVAIPLTILTTMVSIGLDILCANTFGITMNNTTTKNKVSQEVLQYNIVHFRTSIVSMCSTQLSALISGPKP